MSIQHPVNMPSAVFVVSCFFWAYNHKNPSDDALKQPLLCTNVPIISSSTLTCCHDDACQHFSPCMRGRKVVCQLTELIHNQTRDRISQNLELHTRTHTQKQTEQQEAMHTCRHTNTSLCQICQLTKHVWCYPPLEHCVPVTVLALASNSTRSVETATSETRLTPWGIPNHLSSNAVWVLSDSYNLPSPSWQWITRQKKEEEQSKQANLSNRCSATPHKGLKIESKLCDNFTSLLFMDAAPLAALYSSLMWWKMTTSMRRDDGWVIAN